MFTEHCLKAAMFTEMYKVLEELYIFFSKGCKRDFSLERSAAESGKCSETSEFIDDLVGLQLQIQ